MAVRIYQKIYQPWKPRDRVFVKLKKTIRKWLTVAKTIPAALYYICICVCICVCTYIGYNERWLSVASRSNTCARSLFGLRFPHLPPTTSIMWPLLLILSIVFCIIFVPYLYCICVVFQLYVCISSTSHQHQMAPSSSFPASCISYDLTSWLVVLLPSLANNESDDQINNNKTCFLPPDWTG